MLMGLVFIIEVVEGGNLVGGFEAISLSELKNYPEIEKGLEKGMDEYNANLRKEVPQVTKRYTDCYSTIFYPCCLDCLGPNRGALFLVS